MKHNVYIVILQWNNFDQCEIIQMQWTYFFFLNPIMISASELHPTFIVVSSKVTRPTNSAPSSMQIPSSLPIQILLITMDLEIQTFN